MKFRQRYLISKSTISWSKGEVHGKPRDRVRGEGGAPGDEGQEFKMQHLHRGGVVAPLAYDGQGRVRGLLPFLSVALY